MTHPFQLEDMRIAITGAGGGIGAEVAKLAAALGADVMVSDLKEDTEPVVGATV